MLRMNTHLGAIMLTEGYLSNLIGHAATGCFGVVRMNPASPAQGLKKVLKRAEELDDGVKVTAGDSPKAIVIDLHITVMYGVNVSAITDSIMNKVKYVVERETGLTVSAVNVFVDGMENS